MAIVRIGKGSFCRLERSRAFEILKADSSYYKVVGTFDVAQRTLSKLMAIYREKCSVRSGRPKKDTDLSLVKKNRGTSTEEKYCHILCNNMVG